MRQHEDLRTAGERLVYLASERTLLAWLRTAFAAMALGFAIDRLGLVLQRTGHGRQEVLPRGAEFWVGTTLVVLGVLMTIFAAVRYWLFSLRYHRHGEAEPGRGLSAVLVLCGLVALVGVVVAVYMAEVGG